MFTPLTNCGVCPLDIISKSPTSTIVTPHKNTLLTGMMLADADLDVPGIYPIHDTNRLLSVNSIMDQQQISAINYATIGQQTYDGVANCQDLSPISTTDKLRNIYMTIGVKKSSKIQKSHNMTKLAVGTSTIMLKSLIPNHIVAYSCPVCIASETVIRLMFSPDAPLPDTPIVHSLIMCAYNQRVPPKFCFVLCYYIRKMYYMKQYFTYSKYDLSGEMNTWLPILMGLFTCDTVVRAGTIRASPIEVPSRVLIATLTAGYRRLSKRGYYFQHKESKHMLERYEIPLAMVLDACWAHNSSGTEVSFEMYAAVRDALRTYLKQRGVDLEEDKKITKTRKIKIKCI